MRKSTLFVIFLLVFATLSACDGANDTADDGRIKVVATIAQISDIATNIGGEHVNIHGLMGPGSDPHLYVASASDVERLQSADIIFYNGLFLEAQMEDILEQLGERQTVVAVAGSISTDRLLESQAYDDEFDPHIWFDVELWQEATIVVRDTLIDADPDNAVAYEANADAYMAELVELHDYVVARAAEIPTEQRVLVTAHDAFGYFGNAYGFDVVGLQGISTAAEAGTADVQELADFIADNQIPAIFIESSVPVRNIEAVQAAVASRGFDVKIGGELFSDAMGNPDTPEGTYLGMVRHNIDTIVSALSE